MPQLRVARLRAALAVPLLWLAAAGSCADGEPRRPEDLERLRRRMVDEQIVARGVRDAGVVEAMRSVPRHLFVPARYRHLAYEDRPLPIGSGQTISQPYMVGIMTELLGPEPGDRVLEVGTGSGYQAAVLSTLVAQVFTIEIVPELAEQAARRLETAGYGNVRVVTGDGYRGLPDQAPFDGIVVTAAPERVPEPLLEQLAPGGRMVIPIGGREQTLQVLERTEQGVRRRRLFEVRFVPMTGEAEQGAPRAESPD